MTQRTQQLFTVSWYCFIGTHRTELFHSFPLNPNNGGETIYYFITSSYRFVLQSVHFVVFSVDLQHGTISRWCVAICCLLHFYEELSALLRFLFRDVHRA